ncbi:hypothetical protein SK79_01224 [Escherichia coli]|nr:hypothetical protein SK79_01224 [Escherichia coli]
MPAGKKVTAQVGKPGSTEHHDATEQKTSKPKGQAETKAQKTPQTGKGRFKRHSKEPTELAKDVHKHKQRNKLVALSG